MAPRDATDTLLFGRNLALSARLTALAGALFVLSLFVHLPARYLDAVSLTGPIVTAAVFLTMLLIAAGAAYINDGALISVALSAGVGIGFYAPAVLFHLRSPGESTLWVLVVGSFSSLAMGVVGFAVGAGARRLLAE